MCGYVSYQDPRLQPFESDDEPEEQLDYENCAHGEACRALLARLRGYDADENAFFWVDRLIADLGCKECRMWEEI